MSISVTTDKFIAWYMEFGTVYGFSKKLTLSLTTLLMFKQAILKPRLAGKTNRHIGRTRTTWMNFVVY